MGNARRHCQLRHGLQAAFPARRTLCETQGMNSPKAPESRPSDPSPHAPEPASPASSDPRAEHERKSESSEAPTAADQQYARPKDWPRAFPGQP